MLKLTIYQQYIPHLTPRLGPFLDHLRPELPLTATYYFVSKCPKTH